MSRASPTLLIVEDDSDLRDALVEILTAEGLTIVATANGDAALSWLETHPPPALVLLDMWTPQRDSWLLLDSLHLRPTFADVPVVTISSGEEKHPVIREVLQKPFDRDVLVACVRRFVHPLH
ncbi:response regulator [Corallococcus sp. ZKHCc1 1396]|uniref:Response regulator n=1 Tax=Corallococcus soli TaxID=2710757 RepID=A0ABR9PFP3_9BACT|nr:MULTISPECIES: response regulator [Corallococcus]MBE4746664.1 response regulator [Corallococcus soli]MCY1030212.1 response regulator [Corallococcus sp. BB11-1]